MDSILSAFGVPATVTRPAPDDTPIDTTVAWVTSFADAMPGGQDFKRVERRRVLTLTRDDVPTAPKNTVIVAPERAGEDDRTWKVHSTEQEDADHIRVLVLPVE
jgi:hypothetical protein